VVLSFGIPFALVPLVRITSNRTLMALAPSRRLTIVLAWTVVAVVVTFNAALIVLLVR
jgi:manganese transport protein